MTAKKRKKRDKPKNKKQRKSKVGSRKRPHLDRLLSDRRTGQRPLVVSPSGVQKMSEVIKDFARPLLDQCENNESARGVITLAISAWNIALLPDEEQEEAVAEALAALSQSVPDEFFPALKTDFRMLIDRKKTCYADIDRDIIDFQFMEWDGCLGFDVMSYLYVGE